MIATEHGKRVDFLIENTTTRPLNCFFEPVCSEIDLKPGEVLSVANTVNREAQEEYKKHTDATDVILETSSDGITIWAESWHDEVVSYVDGRYGLSHWGFATPEPELPYDFDPAFKIVFTPDPLPSSE